MKNSVSRWICCLTTALIVTGFMAPAALAEVSKEAKELRHMQMQLSAAQKEKAALETQVDDLKKQIAELGSKSAALEKKSGGQHKQFAELTEKYQELDKNLQLMTQQNSDANKNLQQLREEKEQEQKRLSGDVQLCEKKNAELYRISTDMMDKYRNKGVFSALMQDEPFTQIEKVKMDNLLQEYRDKADAAKIVSTKAPAALPVNDTSPSANNASASTVTDSKPFSRQRCRRERVRKCSRQCRTGCSPAIGFLHGVNPGPLRCPCSGCCWACVHSATKRIAISTCLPMQTEHRISAMYRRILATS